MSESFWEKFVAAILVALPPTLLAWAAVRAAKAAADKGAETSGKLDQLSITVDGRLTQLLQQTTLASEAKGHAAGRVEGKLEGKLERKAAPPPTPPPEPKGEN